MLHDCSGTTSRRVAMRTVSTAALRSACVLVEILGLEIRIWHMVVRSLFTGKIEHEVLAAQTT